MKTKILSIIIIFTIIFSLVSIVWLDHGSRKIDFFKVRDTIEGIGFDSQDFRNDIEYITACIELVEFCYQDLNAKYTITASTSSEIYGKGDYYYLRVTADSDENFRILNIETSYTLDDSAEFKEFSKKVLWFYTQTFFQLQAYNTVTDILTPDGEPGLILISVILRGIFNFMRTFVIGFRCIISFIPVVVMLFVDSLSIVKDLVILPFRLLL